MICSEMNDDQRIVTYPIFKSHKNLFAFTTTRLTLEIEHVRFSNHRVNQLKLAEVLELNPEKLVFPGQTHSSCVRELTEHNGDPISETDALVTSTPGLCICVQTADCVPILLFDPEEKVIAAIHAGWRGTVGKIVKVAVQKMKTNYHCQAKNILAAVGPSIGADIYEVGEEVAKAARISIPNAEQTLRKNTSGKFHFNLWEANRQLLLESGLNKGNIEILGECSFGNCQKYYSARRDGLETGRMVSGIVLS